MDNKLIKELDACRGLNSQLANENAHLKVKYDKLKEMISKLITDEHVERSLYDSWLKEARKIVNK